MRLRKSLYFCRRESDEETDSSLCDVGGVPANTAVVVDSRARVGRECRGDMRRLSAQPLRRSPDADHGTHGRLCAVPVPHADDDDSYGDGCHTVDSCI